MEMTDINAAPAAQHTSTIGSNPKRDGVSYEARKQWLDDTFSELVDYSTLPLHYNDDMRAAFDAGVSSSELPDITSADPSKVDNKFNSTRKDLTYLMFDKCYMTAQVYTLRVYHSVSLSTAYTSQFLRQCMLEMTPSTVSSGHRELTSRSPVKSWLIHKAILGEQSEVKFYSTTITVTVMFMLTVTTHTRTPGEWRYWARCCLHAFPVGRVQRHTNGKR
jgi:hypothetical protein